jgi:AcrR family transcriptional regulator
MAKQSSLPDPPAPNLPDTREKLKEVAQRLFADRGIDGVAVRDIVSASGQRNAASVHYYFGGKDALVRELLEDGARRIDLRRNTLLDELEREGPLTELRQAVDILVRSSLPQAAERGTASTYLRFIAMLQLNHRHLFLEAIEGRCDSGYQRVLAHLRRLLQGMPDDLVSQRLLFMGLFLTQAMATWEASWGSGRADSIWHRPLVLQDIVDTATAVLLAPSRTADQTAAAQAAQTPSSTPRKAPQRQRRLPAKKTPGHRR